MGDKKTVAEMWGDQLWVWAQHAGEDLSIVFRSSEKSDVAAPWVTVEFRDGEAPAFTIIRRKTKKGKVVSSLKVWLEKDAVWARPENASEAVEIWPEEVDAFLEDSVVRRIEQSREELIDRLIGHG